MRRAIERIASGEADWKVLWGWLPVVLLLFFGTGLRRREALLARWDHVDWERRSLRVPAENAKNREERVVGLGKILFRELAGRRQAEGFILPRCHEDTITKAVMAHFKKCGLDVRLHDTRHTYTSLLQQEAGASPQQAMQRTGHADMAMLSHHTHGEFDEVFEDRLPFLADPDPETVH